MKLKISSLYFVFVISGTLISPSLVAGLPSYYGTLPKGSDGKPIKSLGYELLASMDDKNPRKISKKEVYFLPSAHTVEIGLESWSDAVFKNGKRGGLCEGFDQRINVIGNLEKELLRLSEGTKKNEEKLEGFHEERRSLEKKVAKECAELKASEKLLDSLRLEREAAYVNIVKDFKRQERERGREESKEKDSRSDGDPDPSSERIQGPEDIERRIGELVLRIPRLAAPCTRAEEELKYVEADIARMDSGYFKKIGEFADALTRIQAGAEWYGKANGGHFSGSWNDGYKIAQERLEQANPWLKVRRLPQKQLNMYVGGVERKGLLPGFLGHTFSGQNQAFWEGENGEFDHTKAELPESNAEMDRDDSEEREPGKKGSKKEAASTAANSTAEDNRYFSLLKSSPFSISDFSTSGATGAVSIQTSVVGACSILAQKERKSGSPGIVLSSSSVFPSGSVTRVKATYNLWEILKIIKSKGTRSDGLLGLNKRAYNKLFDEMDKKEVFKFEFLSTDPVELSRQEEVRSQLRAELAARVANTFAAMSRGVDLPEEPRVGNKIVFDTIFQFYPEMRFYRLAELFGDSRRKAKLKAKWNRKIKEKWEHSRITPMVNTVSVNMMFKK